MGMTEIVLLVLGAGVFVASFVLPEKKEKLHEADKRIGEEQIRELVEEQMKEAKTKVSDLVDETVTYAVEKTERSLERVTNEKIMAVNEYSDTVLEAIHKNHEEVVFLYDMLNDKHENLKNTAASMEKAAKETLQKVKEAEAESVSAESVSAESPEAEAATEKIPEEEPVKKEKPVKERTMETLEMDLSFASAGEDGRNNNERILALYKEGKSKVAIAKELGLGIGEVKLVIDLFKGV